MATCVRRQYVDALKKDVIITYVTESQVQEAKWCNTNNHKFDEFDSHIQQIEQKAMTKLEYHDEMRFTDYDRFIEYVAMNDEMLKIKLSVNECEDLFDISKIATISGQIPLSREDDFFYILYSIIIKELPCNLFIHQPRDSNNYTHIIQEYIQTNPSADYKDIPLKYYDINKKYFIRLNECSPKDSALGMGPFTNIQKMFESLICSCRARKALQKAYYTGFDNEENMISISDYMESKKNNDNDIDINMVKKKKKKMGFDNFGNGTWLFCIPWRDDIKSRNEFRCFIRNNKLMAITQYVWYTDYGWINKQDILIKMCVDIQLLANKITQHIKHDQYVLDIHILLDINDQHKPYKVEMIECNSFGAQMAAGSGCFHWIRDYDQLYGIQQCQNQIEIRVVVHDNYTNDNKLNATNSTTLYSNKSPILDIIDELLNMFQP